MSTDNNKSEREKEIEEAKKRWNEWFKNKQGTISAEFPPTIFDKELNKSDTGINEVKKLYKLLKDK